MPVRMNRDVLAGLAFVLLGGLMWYLGRDLPRGSALRMGPGYVPMMLAGITTVLGTLLAVTSWRRSISPGEPWNLAAVATILVAILVFALTVSRFGALPAMTAAGILSQLPLLRRRPVAVMALSLAIAAALVGIFILGLGMHIRILPGG